MGKVVKMIPVNEKNYLFVLGISEKGKLYFRTTDKIEVLQKEDLIIKDDIVYTTQYHFHVKWLIRVEIIKNLGK